MKTLALALLGLVLAFATGCQTRPEPTATGGYKGIERIQILTKGME